jgi:hypothetical protein
MTTADILSKPRRILGFNPAVGRGYVVSMDQRSGPEFLFLDTPSHPNLQMVCGHIIDQHAKDIAAKVTATARDRPTVGDVNCDGLTFRFFIRFVSPESNAKLLELLENVYIEDEDFKAKHGMIVMIPAMQGTRMESLWGSSSCRRGRVCTDISKESLDRWIEGIACDDNRPF